MNVVAAAPIHPPDFIERVAEGRRFRVYTQERETSCGPACFRTVAYYLKGNAPPEDWIRVHTKQNMISPAILAKINALGLQAMNRTAEVEHLAPLFRALGLHAKGEHIQPAAVQERVQNAGRSRVYMTGITWAGGGGHWVVVPYVNGANIVVLDPAPVIGVVDNFPNYAPAYGNAGVFDGYIMEVAA